MINERYVKYLVDFGKRFALVSIAISIGAKRISRGYGNIEWGIKEWGS